MIVDSVLAIRKGLTEHESKARGALPPSPPDDGKGSSGAVADDDDDDYMDVVVKAAS